MLIITFESPYGLMPESGSTFTILLEVEREADAPKHFLLILVVALIIFSCMKLDLPSVGHVSKMLGTKFF